ncbi:integrase/recombinase XerD [Flavobacterium croceum DSM 17960]|uniref:Integrase/recombinase XerD n=1 Tax=Flavobacterium croceum DSM 17960 TaxID=1121886 RepID=A0A2S4N4L0_9FLAO|nr:tyrosine-type recombinase/integrase [Flavobacterium croceum]POS00647.1 integrase/recombinase XerD [Flavobacterium croceum DSM 17960]
MTNETLKNYLNYLIIKGYNEETSHNRTGQVKEFLDFIKLSFEQINEEHINQYYYYLKQRPNKKYKEKTISINTVIHHIRAIELYFEMLYDTGKLKEPLQINISYPRNYQSDFKREFLSQDEIEKLYKVANPLETIIIHLAYGCGLRVAELVAVTKQDIYTKENILIVPKGKFNKRRIIPLTEKITQDLQEYLQSIEGKQNTFILNSKGRKMQEWTYNKILKQLLKRIKIKQDRINKLSIHSLRHSIATHLLQNGMELEKVRDFLGHNQLETTETYTHISMNQMRSIREHF